MASEPTARERAEHVVEQVIRPPSREGTESVVSYSREIIAIEQAIAYAESAAYERGAMDMRERAAQSAHIAEVRCISAVERIRALPLRREGTP